jgi:hypothetical protein
MLQSMTITQMDKTAMRLVGQSKLGLEGISSCSKIWMFEGCDQNTQARSLRPVHS